MPGIAINHCHIAVYDSGNARLKSREVMSRIAVDLYLGGDLGAWVLDRVEPGQIRTVVTAESDLAHLAQARGHDTCTGAPPVDATSSAIAFSVHYPTILTAATLSQYAAAYNLHPGYLPWGRGYYPAFWALLEGTPAGATLHQMTERLDGGPIVEQIEVPYSESDTGASLLNRVRIAEKELFATYWPKVCAGETLRLRPQQGVGSYHSRAAFFEVKRPQNWKQMDSETLIRRVRCLTFPGYTGMEIAVGDRLVHLALQDVT